MKRIFALFLALALLCGGALACVANCTGDPMEIVNCEEYISLRSEPGTDAEAFDFIPLGGEATYLYSYDEDFAHLLYNGRTGYALRKYLANRQEICRDCAEVELSREERRNLNLFLSNFTEQGMLWPAGVLEAESMDDVQLVNFAIEHIWYNRQELLEWGDYFDGNNVRLSDEHIPAVCEKYFGRTPVLIHDVEYDMADGRYYWQETGGHVPQGFATLTDVRDMGGGRYRVNFRVYGLGMGWEDEVYSLTGDELARSHPEYLNGSVHPASGAKFYPLGNAIVNVNGGSLSDRSSWTLERLALAWA